VRLDRHEILVDERRGVIVSIGFGFQPNARASSRSSAEINEQRFLFLLGFGECRVCIFVPLHGHLVIPPKIRNKSGNAD
jgi:hypothetical protein